MKNNKAEQINRVNMSVAILSGLKRRVEDAAQREGTTRDAWVAKALEARLASQETDVEERLDVESPEFLHEEKLDNIRAMREVW